MVNEFQGMKLLILGGMRISCEIILWNEGAV